MKVKIVIVHDYVETLYGTNDYVDLVGPQLFALWITGRRREKWRNIVGSRDRHQGTSSQVFIPIACYVLRNAILCISDDSTSILESFAL